jgi:hypothetical protein
MIGRLSHQSMNTRWANSEEVGSSGVFEALHLGLTVQLTVTSRDEIIIESFQIGRSKTKLRNQLNKIQTLRDNVAHAKEYAATPEQARDVRAVVRDLLALRAEIAGTCGLS